jgi:hypothetical protein
MMASLMGDRDLIVVTIQRPGLRLTAGEPASVHAQMKWVFVMVHRLAHLLEALTQLGLAKQTRL